MKAKIIPQPEQPKTFEPVTIQVTIETEQELLTNASANYHHIIKAISRHISSLALIA